MISQKKEAVALSQYIKTYHGSLQIPGPETERLQYLRTKILTENELIRNRNKTRD